jgi:hypothetical protein
LVITLLVISPAERGDHKDGQAHLTFYSEWRTQVIAIIEK